MSEEIKELTGNETIEELEAYFAAKGVNVTDVEEVTEEELSEEDLEGVAGGMGYLEAFKIVSVAYYEAKKYGRIKSYSKKKVNQALDKADVAVTAIGQWGIKTLTKFLTTGTI